MHDRFWLVIGLIAQLLFGSRFLVQWITSERRGRSTVPVTFWYFSLAGGFLLLAYSIARRDLVFILGQSLGLLVYVRNLMLVGRREHAGVIRLAPWLALCALSTVMAFAALGTRGLWEPDEGRYAESAREMLVSGDFMTPMLGGQPHFTKPPLVYWLIAGSLSAFGPTEAAVRLPTAVGFGVTVMLVAVFGALLWGRRTGLMAGVIYATFITTFAAANIVTPDTPLALWEALALYSFWRGFNARTQGERRLWPAVTGAAFGLAMLTKGPPGLLFLPAMLLFRALPAGRRPGAAPVLSLTGVFLFLGIGLSWYVYSVARNPELMAFFIGEEVVGRVLGHHHRNQQWYGALAIYGPTLLLGALPWSIAWPGIARRWRESLSGEHPLAAISHRPRALLLGLAFAIPLVVLTISRSRLPLYLLPLFVPLALLTARGFVLAAEESGRPLVWNLIPLRWARVLPVWVAALIVARVVFAAWPSPNDARRLYRSLPQGKGAELVVDDSRTHYGLAFYYARDAGDRAEVEYARWPDGSERGGTVSLAEEIAEESQPTSHSHLFVVSDKDRSRFDELLSEVGATIRQTARFPGGFAVLTERRSDQRPLLRAGG